MKPGRVLDLASQSTLPATGLMSIEWIPYSPEPWLNGMEDSRYFLIESYRHLMTEGELRANAAFLYELKMPASGDSWLQKRKTQALEDPEAALLFSKGREKFLTDLKSRLLRDHGDEIVRCKKCGHIVRTPAARQCFACGYDWH